MRKRPTLDRDSPLTEEVPIVPMKDCEIVHASGFCDFSGTIKHKFLSHLWVTHPSIAHIDDKIGILIELNLLEAIPTRPLEICGRFRNERRKCMNRNAASV
jgi:hypothetical protein